MEFCVQMRSRAGPCKEERYLTAKTFIPAGALMTAMGGVTVQEKTQPKAYASFTSLHTQQHDKDGADKFQYSVHVGSNSLDNAWLVPREDIELLRPLLKQKDSHLRKVTGDDMVSSGLGQYAQHTCCQDHVNAHLFPISILQENEEKQTRNKRGNQYKDCEWMELKTVAIRADRDIERDEEIFIHYVGSGKSGHFRKVFSPWRAETEKKYSRLAVRRRTTKTRIT
jgi:hypothetical protein